MRVALALGLLFAAGSLAAIWPVTTQVREVVPIGSERVATVPFLNIWTMQLNMEKMGPFPDGYWGAPIFYPYESSFALSDPQPAAGALGLLVQGFGPAGSYNAVLLIYLFLNGVAGFIMMRRLAFSRLPAAIGGAFIQFAPFVTHERGVLQLQPVFVVLAAVTSVIEFRKSPGTRVALILGLVLGTGFLFSEYYGVLALIASLPWLGLILFERRGAARPLLISLALMLAIAGPLLISQNSVLEASGLSRSRGSVESGSASLGDYLSPSQTIFASALAGTGSVRFGLYPGGIILALALLGGVSLWREADRGAEWLPLMISGGLALGLSFGLNLELGGFNPYEWIWRTIPGFAHLRSPFRFGVWAQICAMAVAVLALGRLARGRYRPIAALICILALVEIFPLPARAAPVPADAPLRKVESPAVFLPFASGRSPSAYYPTARWMLLAQRSDIVIANGYSGYFPADHAALKEILQDFPDEASLQALEVRGIRSILIPKGWLDAQPGDPLANWLAAGRILDGGEEAGFAIFFLPG